MMADARTERVDAAVGAGGELIDLLAELGQKTFDRLEQVGQGPPKTQLLDRRIGYRITDIAAWLDARRRRDSFEQIGAPAARVSNRLTE